MGEVRGIRINGEEENRGSEKKAQSSRDADDRDEAVLNQKMGKGLISGKRRRKELQGFRFSGGTVAKSSANTTLEGFSLDCGTTLFPILTNHEHAFPSYLLSLTLTYPPPLAFAQPALYPLSTELSSNLCIRLPSIMRSPPP